MGTGKYIQKAYALPSDAALESCIASVASRRRGMATVVCGSERKRQPTTGLSVVEIVACEGGTRNALPRRETSMTRRVNSSLRSRPTSEAQCSAVRSGLDKILFASVGPNSHGRGHRFSEVQAIPIDSVFLLADSHDNIVATSSA